MEEYKITLTKDELEILKDAINYQNVYKYHKEIDSANKKGDEISAKFWTDEWHKSLNLFCKLVEVTEDK